MLDLIVCGIIVLVLVGIGGMCKKERTITIRY